MIFVCGHHAYLDIVSDINMDVLSVDCILGDLPIIEINLLDYDDDDGNDV